MIIKDQLREGCGYIYRIWILVVNNPPHIQHTLDVWSKFDSPNLDSYSIFKKKKSEVPSLKSRLSDFNSTITNVLTTWVLGIADRRKSEFLSVHVQNSIWHSTSVYSGQHHDRIKSLLKICTSHSKIVVVLSLKCPSSKGTCN